MIYIILDSSNPKKLKVGFQALYSGDDFFEEEDIKGPKKNVKKSVQMYESDPYTRVVPLIKNEDPDGHTYYYMDIKEMG